MKFQLMMRSMISSRGENANSKISDRLQLLTKLRQTLHDDWIFVIDLVDLGVKKFFRNQQQYFTVTSFTRRANANQVNVLLLAQLGKYFQLSQSRLRELEPLLVVNLGKRSIVISQPFLSSIEVVQQFPVRRE